MSKIFAQDEGNSVAKDERNSVENNKSRQNQPTGTKQHNIKKHTANEFENFNDENDKNEWLIPKRSNVYKQRKINDLLVTNRFENLYVNTSVQKDDVYHEESIYNNISNAHINNEYKKESNRRRPQVVVSKNPEYQNDFRWGRRKQIVPNNVTKHTQRNSNVVLFSDSMTKPLKMEEFN